jgi:hypothetical protein
MSASPEMSWTTKVRLQLKIVPVEANPGKVAPLTLTLSPTLTPTPSSSASSQTGTPSGSMVLGLFKMVSSGVVWLVDIPPELEDFKLQAEMSQKGSKEGCEATAKITASLPGKLNLKANVNVTTDKTENRTVINFTVNLEVYYSKDFTKKQAEQLLLFVPMISGILQSMISKATDGKASLDKLTLTNSNIGEEKAAFTFEGTVSGNLSGGMARALEKAAEGELIIPGVMLKKPSEEQARAMKVFASLIRKLSAVNYAWVKEGTISLYWDSEEKAIKFKGESLIEGDINRQYAEVIHTTIEHYPDILTGEYREYYEECKFCQNLRQLALSSTFNVENIALTVKVEDGKVTIEFSNFKVKPECPKCLLVLIGKASEERSNERLLFTVKAGSTISEMVQLTLPEDVEPKPVSAQPPYKYTWKFSNLMATLESLAVEVKPNWTGIADFNYASEQLTLPRGDLKVEVFTSGLEITAIRAEEASVAVKVTGPEGVKTKLCVKLPTEAVEGIVLASMGKGTIRPEVKLLADDSIVALITCRQSEKIVKFWWIKPTITLTLSKNQAELGEPVFAFGTLLAGDIPLASEAVQILADGKPTAIAITGGDGTFVAPITISEGSHQITAAYNYLSQTYQSNSATAMVTLPWYHNPLILSLITVAIVVVTITLIVKYKSMQKRKGEHIE